MNIFYIEDILLEMVELINAGRDVSVQNEKIEQLSKSIMGKYNAVIRDYGHDVFYSVLRDEFQNDHELLVLILSVLNYVTNVKEHIFEIHRILGEGKIDFMASLNIRAQLERNIFLNPQITGTYRIRRELHENLLRRFRDLLQLDMTPVSFDERNHKQIVLVTNQLLGYLHGPTRIVVEIASELKNLGYDVIVIVAYEEMLEERMQQFWYNPFRMNLVKEYNGNFQLQYEDKQIKGYQFCISYETMNNTRNLLKEIVELKPGLVWYIGSHCLFADLMRSFTTVAAMPCTDGYAISEAQILISYMNSKSPDVKAAEIYNKEKGQTMLYMELYFSFRRSNKIYSRMQFLIPNDAFVITIVGNRLDSEISEEFLVILNRVLAIDEKIFLVFIGCFDRFYDMVKKLNWGSRAVYIGYQEDLVQVLALMDLFLNPKRKGAGGGALGALGEGVPVITLDYCDVANAAGKDFVCRDMDEMVLLVQKYFYDKEFYQHQSQLARGRLNTSYDMSSELKRVIYEIEKLERHEVGRDIK